jgi:hypothetical protein
MLARGELAPENVVLGAHPRDLSNRAQVAQEVEAKHRRAAAGRLDDAREAIYCRCFALRGGGGERLSS